MPTNGERTLKRAMDAADYELLADFRYQLRLFLRSSEDEARKAGLEPQQHQLLLAIKGARPGSMVSVGALSERLQVRHHSLGGLVDRLEQRRLVKRHRSTKDRRIVEVGLTPAGERLLDRLSEHHLELLQATDGLAAVLARLVRDRGQKSGR